MWLQFKHIFQVVASVIGILLLFCFVDIFTHEYCPDKTVKQFQCVAKPNTKKICEKYKGVWYLVVPECKTHDEAKKHCRFLGLQISNIRSLDQSNWLSQKSCAHKNEMWWSGPRRNRKMRMLNADYSLLPGGAETGSKPYWDGDKSSGKYSCAVYGFNGHREMSVKACNYKYKFFCETKYPGCNIKRPDYEYCPVKSIPLPYNYEGEICVPKPNSRRVCEEYEGVWYLPVPLCKTYEDAKLHCQSLGLHMANIRSANQSYWLSQKSCAYKNEMWWSGPYLNKDNIMVNADSTPLTKEARKWSPSYWHTRISGVGSRCAVYGFASIFKMVGNACSGKHKFFCESKNADCATDTSEMTSVNYTYVSVAGLVSLALLGIVVAAVMLYKKDNRDRRNK